MLKHESLLSQQKSAKNGQNLWGEPLMGNKLSNLGHYRTLSPGLGPELPITAEVSVVASWGGGLCCVFTGSTDTSSVILQGTGDNKSPSSGSLPGSNNPDMASHHIAAGVPSPNCARDNVIKLKKVIFQAWRQLQIFSWVWQFELAAGAGGWTADHEISCQIGASTFNRSHSIPSLQREQPEPTSLKRNWWKENPPVCPGPALW